MQRRLRRCHLSFTSHAPKTTTTSSRQQPTPTQSLIATKFLTATLAICASALAFALTPAAAMTDAECVAALAAADTKKDGVVKEAEAGRYFARHRNSDKAIADCCLTYDAFLGHCTAGSP